VTNSFQLERIQVWWRRVWPLAGDWNTEKPNSGSSTTDKTRFFR
jgi:hypothetical protein